MLVRRLPLVLGITGLVVAGTACGDDDVGTQRAQPSAIDTEPSDLTRRVLSEEEVAEWVAEQERLRGISEELGFPGTVSEVLDLGADVRSVSTQLDGMVVRASDGTPVLCPPGGPEGGDLTDCVNNTSIALGGDLGLLDERSDGDQVVLQGLLVAVEDTPYSGYPWVLDVESVSDDLDATSTECNYEAAATGDTPDVFSSEAHDLQDQERAFNEELLGQIGAGDDPVALFELLLRSDGTAYFVVGAGSDSLAAELADRLGRPVHLATYGRLVDGC